MSQLLRQRMAGGLKCQKTLDSTVRPGEVTFGVEDTPSAKASEGHRCVRAGEGSEAGEGAEVGLGRPWRKDMDALWLWRRQIRLWR